MSDPHRIYGWLDSQLSIARHYGGCTINGKTYRIRYDLEGQPLEELLTKRKAKREKRDEAIDLFFSRKDAEGGESMNRDDIIRMAKEAGAIPSGDPQEWDVWLFQDPAMERFTALVAAEKDKEIAELKHERRRDMAEICSLREAEESLREENERLREALKKYGQHRSDCAYREEQT